MVTLDERVEAMMTLNNRNWKDTSSPARRGTGSRNESSGRLLDRDAYFSRPDYSDSSRVQDDDSLIKSDYGIYEKHRRPSYEQGRVALQFLAKIKANYDYKYKVCHVGRVISMSCQQMKGTPLIKSHLS